MGLFVTAMHLLNQRTITTTDINIAKHLIEHYQRMNCSLFGKAADTFTVHALRHLPDQIHLHGANLVLMSNFIFEGFIATMKRQYHGSRGIIPQMVRNIRKLQNVHNIAHKIIKFCITLHN